MHFIQVLQLGQKFGVLGFEFLRNAQQDHVLGGPVARKIIQLARDIGLGGGGQCIDQAAAGLQNKTRLVAPVLPKSLRPSVFS